MAKIAALPSMAVIDGLRGCLDFYDLRGTACVRSWPRWKIVKRAPDVQTQIDIFTYANHKSVTLSPEVVESWKWLADQSNMTWRDWLNRAYLGGTLTAPGKAAL